MLIYVFFFIFKLQWVTTFYIFATVLVTLFYLLFHAVLCVDGEFSKSYSSVLEITPDMHGAKKFFL